jgi:hypothetical protein
VRKLVVATAIAVPLVLCAGAGVTGGVAMAAGPTAEQVARHATADLKAAKTYHFWETTGSGKKAIKQNVTRGTNGCEGTVSDAGTTTSFVQIGSTTWLKVGQTWLKESTSQAGGALPQCKAGYVAELVPTLPNLAFGPVTKVNGQRVQELKGSGQTLYVTTGATPEYARYELSGKLPEQLNVSGINAKTKINPPSGKVVSA